jgi:hypothetical protein
MCMPLMRGLRRECLGTVASVGTLACRVAQEVDAETLAWLAEVAAGMLAAMDEKDANKRHALALKAAGVVGRASQRKECERLSGSAVFWL